MLMLWRRETRSIIDMATSWNTILTYLYGGLLRRWLLLHLLIYLLWTLMTWNLHALLILSSIIALNKYILVRIRVFTWEESSLSLPFSSIFNHTFLGSWTFTFSYVWNCFKPSNNLCKALILLWILLLS